MDVALMGIFYTGLVVLTSYLRPTMVRSNSGWMCLCMWYRT